MATKGSVELNSNMEEVFDKFKDLTVKEMGRALKTGVRKGLILIRNRARQRFRGMFPSGARVNPKYSDKLIDGIRATKVQDDKKDGVKGYVLITSNRRSGSGSYRLVFLEGGTVKRHTRRGYNRGSIKASFFFTSTVNSEQSNYRNTVVNELEKTVDKINSTNLK